MADLATYRLDKPDAARAPSVVVAVGKIVTKYHQIDSVRVKQLLDQMNLDKYTTTEQMELVSLVRRLRAASRRRQPDDVSDVQPCSSA